MQSIHSKIKGTTYKVACIQYEVLCLYQVEFMVQQIRYTVRSEQVYLEYT